jgi:hypothetical protein
MEQIQYFRKKLNKDGTPFVDPETNDFVAELFHSEETKEVEYVEEKKLDASNLDVETYTDEQLIKLKERLSKL